MGDADVEKKLKLYLRLPIKIEEELQIKNLHPDIIKVYLPRQKTRRWCIIEFSNNETLESAKVELKTQQINGKNLVVGPFLKGEKIKTKRFKKLTFKAESLLDLLKKDEKKD